MSQHPFYSLSCPNKKGQLLLTPCPGTVNEPLIDSLKTLKAEGVAAVVTLMTHSDLAEHNVVALGSACEALALQWFHLPISDESVPDADVEKAWNNASARIHRYLDQNKAVVVHCKGGSGRTGIIAGKILLERGLPLSEVIGQIRALRPSAFSHSVQMEYIEAQALALK